MIHALEIEHIADYWDRLAGAFHDPAAVQCSAEYNQSMDSSCSQLKTESLEEDVWCTLGHHVQLLEETMCRTHVSLQTTAL